jgi:hypothetical protein
LKYICFAVVDNNFGINNQPQVKEPTAAANVAAVKAFKAGLAAVQAGECTEIMVQLLTVRKQMEIALIQGMLQYAYKSDARVESSNRPKTMAEAWAFTAGVLPMIHVSLNSPATIQTYDIKNFTPCLLDVFIFLPISALRLILYSGKSVMTP